MQYSPDSTRAALLLTNRLVPLDVKPLTAREFWKLVEQADPGDLLHDDAAGLIAQPGLEAVILCTPHPLHAAQIVAAAEAGLHVFCEKPLCLTLEEWQSKITGWLHVTSPQALLGAAICLDLRAIHGDETLANGLLD